MITHTVSAVPLDTILSTGAYDELIRHQPWRMLYILADAIHARNGRVFTHRKGCSNTDVLGAGISIVVTLSRSLRYKISLSATTDGTTPGSMSMLPLLVGRANRSSKPSPFGG